MDDEVDKLIAAVREAVRQARELRAALATERKQSVELRRQSRELVAGFRRAQAEMRRTGVATAPITSGFRAAEPVFSHVSLLRS